MPGYNPPPMRASPFRWVAVVIFLASRATADSVPPLPTPEELEASGARIGRITISSLNVFDTSDPKEDYRLYRFANKLHVVTKEEVLRRELLFREGDLYSRRLIEETERNLRALGVIYHVRIEPVAYQYGRVDLEVTTQDTWTLRPAVRFSRSGGDNTSGISISEFNLAGRMKVLTLNRRNNVDRSTTELAYSDPRLFGTRFAMRASYQDLSDGVSRSLFFVRPFFALDTPWSFQAGGTHLEQTSKLYREGDVASEFGQFSESIGFAYGGSGGLNDGQVVRWGVGYSYLRNVFSQEAGDIGFVANPSGDDDLDGVLNGADLCPATPPAAAVDGRGCAANQFPLPGVPPDQKFSGPLFTLQTLRARYIKVVNYNQFDRDEDFNLGNQMNLSGQASLREFGADRSELILNFADSLGIPVAMTANLFYNVSLSGRTGAGAAANVLLAQSFDGYWRITDHQTLFGHLGYDVGIHLDAQNQLLLGGDNGLRGYPTRQFDGDRRLLLQVEHRSFTDWEVLSLVRIGFAAFLDLGNAWYAEFGQRFSDLHPDFGAGIRFAISRSSVATVSRVDLAYALDADETNSPRFQILFGTAFRF